MTQSISQNPDPAHRLCMEDIAPVPAIHASCASWEGLGVILTGPSGCGKSSLLLRLIDAGFALVGDDQILMEQEHARPAPALAGLIEIRGLGIVRIPHLSATRVVLQIDLTRHAPVKRLPDYAIDLETGIWHLTLDAFHADAVARIRSTLRCIRGEFTLLCGANGGLEVLPPFPLKREES